MKKKTNKVRHRIEYWVMLAVMFFIQRKSLKAALKFAERLGWFCYRILRIRKKVSLENLTIAFPEKSVKERDEIAFNSYKNFAKMIVEYIRFPIMEKEIFLSNVNVENENLIKDVLESGKGCVLIAGHFGNWEMMGAALAQMGYPLSFLVGEQRNQLVDIKINSFREMMGIKIIHMGVAVRGVIKALRSGEFVALLADQNAGRDGIFIDFFGKKASAHQGPAVFAIKTGAPIIFGSAVRLPAGKHKVETEVLRFDHIKELNDENILMITQAHAHALERAIRKYPDHWFWMHRRWKTRPAFEKE